ncbi:MAG TPA: polyhydroxyalkanoate synthesis regulator DNA-binding domain-containing protein [Xanthobacteraceae bacterium]|jgi:polyhydroxyalkanoate synthesis regulator protein|nr:polyhydroxyalkanoate synthesis regulator DNA-binding domain-containing protein [Xanthobacteraceae bacterium]
MRADLEIPPVLVKRYARARLYDTASARYVSVDELREWKRKGLAFAVVDNKTSKDITEVLLASPLH